MKNWNPFPCKWSQMNYRDIFVQYLRWKDSIISWYMNVEMWRGGFMVIQLCKRLPFLLTGSHWRMWRWPHWEIITLKSQRCWFWCTEAHWSSQWTLSSCTVWICASHSSQGHGRLDCGITALSLLQEEHWLSCSHRKWSWFDLSWSSSGEFYVEVPKYCVIFP
jgi:hypothetical protein